MATKKRREALGAASEATVTILHVSDLQFGIQHRFGRLGLGGADEPFDTLLKRLTDDLDLLRKDEGLAPDLVALTGDLAEWGKPKEYADVLRFCEGVQGALGLGRDRILVIPGNHDINRALCTAYFSEREGLDEKPLEPYWPKWKPYVDFFGELYKGVDRYEFKETAPYTWFELPELSVVVAGLNSTLRESHLDKAPGEPASIFGHYGYVGEAQLAWFQKKLDEAEALGWLRIGLVHHNALRGAEDDDENLRDAHLLKHRLGGKLNLLLHGHTHLGSLEWLGRDLPVISTGSAAVKSAARPEEVPNQYQIIQVHRDGLRCWARQFVPKERKWIGDPRVSNDGSDWRREEKVAFPNTHGTFGAQEPSARSRSRALRFQKRRPGDDVDHDLDDEPFRGRREPDDLLAQVMASCRVRDESGRVQTTRVYGEGLWGDYSRVTDPARGTYLLGAHEGPLTLELLDRWGKDVHEPFRSKGNRGRLSDLVIARREPFAEEVTARAGEQGIRLWSRLDYENLIDTERWKEQQRARLDGDPEYRRELYIEQRVTLWSPVDDVREPVDRAADRLAQMLCEPDGCFVMVLGPAGTGKTFLLREVARRMTERQAIVTPVVVELHRLVWAEDVVTLVSGEFTRRRLSLPVRAFERDLHEGRIALLFDGFDELAIRVRSAAIPEHFARILGASRERARVLVTSRAEHFVSQQAAVDTLMSRALGPSTGLAGQLQTVAKRRLVATQKFTPEDIEDYLARALGSAEAGRARMQRFRKVHDLAGLAATPRMLSFLVRLTDEQLDRAAARADAITSAELYRLVIVDHWLLQQEQRLNPPGAAPGPNREALLESVTRLALHLFRSTAKGIAAAELDAHTGEQLRKLCDEDTEVATQMLQGRTLLVHGEDGRLAFVHQTVMEWLVGQALASEIEATGTCADLEQGRLEDFLIDVLRELLGDEALAAWAGRVLEGTPGNRIAENARLVLSRMKREVEVKRADLRGQDLRGQSLEGQDLSGALLDGADLRGVNLSGRELKGASLQGANLAFASLRGADLGGANLAGADLSFARLDRANLDRAKLTGTLFLATRALGVRGNFDKERALFGTSAAWAVNARALWPVPAGAECLAVAFSPDGRLLASGHEDGLVRLWNAEQAVLLRVLEGHSSGVTSVSWSPDGTRLASGSNDKTLRLWEAGTGKELRTFEGHTHGIMSVSWSPDGTRLASGSYDTTIRLWDAATGKELRTFEGHTKGVMSVSWSPDGTRLVSGSYDTTVCLWQAATGKALWTFAGHTLEVMSVAWSPDGTRLASGADDKTLRLWDAATGEALRRFAGHTGGVMSVAWSPDGTHLTSGSDDTTLRLWDAATGKELRTFAGHTHWVRSVAWSQDGTRLASGADDTTLRLWEAATGKELRTFEGHTNGVISVAWSPDGTRLASGSSDTTLRLWEAATGKELQTFEGHTIWTMSVSWSPDGTRLASGSYDDTLRLWEVATGKELRIFEGHASGVMSVSWSPDGTRLASGSADKTLRLWEAATGKALAVLQGHAIWVRSVSWSPDGTRLASGSSDKTLRLWDAATGNELRTFEGHTDGVRSVSWSPDGTRLASGSSDKTLRLWDAATGKELRTFEGHTHGVRSVSWSPDGTRLASGSADTTVRLWEAATGKALAVLRGHLGPVLSVSFHPGGRLLVSSGADGTLRLWDTATGDCLAVYIATPKGALVYRPRDGRYRLQGDPGGRVAYTFGLARYELGELDEFVPGGLRLPDDEPLLPP
jgi:WD40 repeat protein/3',5'-cyclic AMP phosphodiesterase CpdA